MSSLNLSRRRIRGVSFRHNRSSPLTHTSSSGKFAPRLENWSGPEISALRASAPPPLSDTDLKRLLGDQGRQEIHSLVSDSVDHLTQLHQLARSLNRFLGHDDIKRSMLAGDAAEEPHVHPSQEILIEVMRLQRLWKLRLDILEMLVMAQNSLRNFPGEFVKKHRPKAAGSVPPKK